MVKRKTRKSAKPGKMNERLKKADPFDVLVKSMKDLRHNLMVLVPDLLSFFSLICLALFGVLQFLFLGYLYPETGIEKAEVIVPLALFVLLDLVIAVAVGTYFAGAKYGVIADVLSGRKTSFRRMLWHGKALFPKVLGFSVSILMIMFLPAAVISLIVLAAMLVSETAAGVLAILLFPVYLVFLLAFLAVTIFGAPILIDGKFSGFFSGFRAIIAAFNYAKANPGHVAVTVAFAFFLWLVIQTVSMLFGIPSYLVDYEILMLPYGSGALLTFLYYSAYVVSSFLESLLSLLGGTFLSIFVFNSYFSRNKLDWKKTG